METLRIVLFTFALCCQFAFSQTIVGKLYQKTEADGMYGPVFTSVEVSSGFLASVAALTKDYIMFRISEGKVLILGDQRKSLYPADANVDTKVEVRLFSVSLVKKLIADGNESITKIELRNNNLLTITNGNYTLEYGSYCPPSCPD